MERILKPEYELNPTSVWARPGVPGIISMIASLSPLPLTLSQSRYSILPSGVSAINDYDSSSFLKLSTQFLFLILQNAVKRPQRRRTPATMIIMNAGVLVKGSFTSSIILTAETVEKIIETAQLFINFKVIFKIIIILNG